MKSFSLLSFAAMLLMAVFLVGCDQGVAQNQGADPEALAELTNRVTQLESNLNDANEEITSLKSELEQVSTSGGSGGASLKIGFVNAEEVFVKYSGTQAAIDEYRTQKEGIEGELQDLQDQAAAGTMSQQEFLTKRQELEIRLAELDQQLTNNITERIVATVEELGAEQNFDLITTRKNVVLYYKEDGGIVHDLTEVVLQEMNEAASDE